MPSSSFCTLWLLPTLLRSVIATTESSTACNNSPSLCSKAYDQITYLGAHDSPFLRDASTEFSISGNQYYNTTVQLSAGVRLVTAQLQIGIDDNALHVCHSRCDLLDAGLLSSWLSEVKTWMDSNPREIVTILLVNGAGATASALAAQYQAAGISSDLAYAPTGTTSTTQTWPTLQEMITSGKRLVNFIASISDNSATPWLMNEFDFVFENDYNNNSPTAYSCEPNRPSNVANNTPLVLQNKMLPLMNHFLYEDFLIVQSPNASYAPVTNSVSGGVGALGTAATQCKVEYGRAPTFILVDFFNNGPAIATVDQLNGVTAPVGRVSVSTQTPESSGVGKIGASLFSVATAATAAAAAASAFINGF